MTRVAIVAAFAGELAPLVRRWPHERRQGVDLWRRWHAGGEWIAACAGAGANAAARAFGAIERDGPVDCIVSTGWAGALRAPFAAGRAYRVSGVVDGRTGERFPAAGPGACWLVTSLRVEHPAEKGRLAARWDAGLVDMEAAAVARLAAQRGIPFHCVKGVSDGWAEQLPDFGRFLARDGRFRRFRFLLFSFFRPGSWGALARLGRNSRAAAREIQASLNSQFFGV